MLSGPWLISYLILWLTVVALSLLVVDVLRELGTRRSRTARGTGQEDEEVRTRQDDGPPIGSMIPDWRAESVNGFGMVTINEEGSSGGTLLVFMSPLCEGCQGVVAPLNDVVANRAGEVRAVAVLQGNLPACRAFLNLFPLRIPVIHDEERNLARALGVWGNPFCLAYNDAGILVSKGTIEDGDEPLLALIDFLPRASCADDNGIVAAEGIADTLRTRG